MPSKPVMLLTASISGRCKEASVTVDAEYVFADDGCWCIPFFVTDFAASNHASPCPFFSVDEAGIHAQICEEKSLFFA